MEETDQCSEPCASGASVDESAAPIHQQLLVAFSYSNRAMQARTRAEGLMPGQPKVLEHLHFHDGCSQRDIAEACVMDRSTVTSVLARMEEAGLVERRADPTDRRAVTVSLTERGHAAAQRVCAHGDEVDAIALAGLTDAERDELGHNLARVIANFRAAEGGAR